VTPSARYALLIVFVGAVTGCSWFSDDKGLIVDRSDDYITAKEGPPLILPEGMTSAPIQDVMPIAPVASSRRHGELTATAPLPEAIFAREESSGVKIQKLGDARWLLIAQPPAVVWPKIKQFFADNGVPIAFEKPEAGRIDTEWLTIDKADARDVVRLTILSGKEAIALLAGRDRVRVLIEQGIRDRSSEIHLRYENDSKSVPVEDTMPGQSDVLEIESQMLNEMGAYVAANVADATISYVARNISTQNKAAIESDTQNLPVLRLNLDFERAWATVSQALGEANLPVTDVNRTDGVIYITVSDDVLHQEKKPGVFTRWMHQDKKQAIEVRLVPIDRGYQVTLFDDAGQRVPAELAEQILIMIREFAA
jgi:outer membrane protein assembly factor BamC